MDESINGPVEGRQLDATAANRLAQEIDDAAQGTNLVAKLDAVSGVSLQDTAGAERENAAEHLHGDDPVESQQIERRSGVFPPDLHPTVDIGGTPEDQGALDDEYAGR